MKRQERPAERPRPIASHRPDLDLEEGIGSGEQGGDLCQGKCGAGAVRASHASAAAVRRTCTRCTPSPQQSRVPAVPPITRAGLCHHVSAHGNLRLPRAPHLATAVTAVAIVGCREQLTPRSLLWPESGV